MTEPNAFLIEVRHELVRLEGVIQALDLIDNENIAPTPAGNATTVLIGVARDLSTELARKVDRFTTDAGQARAA